MRIAVRDASDNYNICFLDNQSGLNFHEAQLQIFLQGNASVLTIKLFNKKKDLIQTGYRLSFRYRDKDYWMTITSVKKVGLEIELTALGASLEANKEMVSEYKNHRALGIVDYWKVFDDENNFEIGINEVAEKRITAEWSGNETKLARLFSLAEKFDAELEFTTELNDDYSLKRQVVNIYRQGNLGRQLTGHPLRVGKDIESVSFEENIDEIYTEVIATGKDGLTIEGLVKNVYDDNGELLYFTKGKSILAPQARQRFEGITKRNELQGYILNDLGSTEYETKEKLYAYMLGEIKKHSTPKVTYEISGFVDINIGDRLMISDSENYSPTLYLEARVTEQTYDLLDPENNKSTFSNVVERFSKLNDDILKRVEQMIQNAKLLQVTLLTEDFLGNKKEVLITTKLMQNALVLNASNYKFEYRLDGKVILDDDYTGSTLSLPLSEYSRLADSEEQATLTVTVYDTNNSYQGTANAIIRKLDAIKSYTHFAYSDYPDGRDFSFTEPNKKYLGVCTTTNENPPNTASEYKWSLIKGENGIPGKSGYVHIAYANTPDGSGDFSTTEGEGKLYIGTYTDHTEYDSTDHHAYTWSRIKGEDGTDGKDGKQLYTWLKYADSPTSGMSDLPIGKSYIGIAYNRETSEESTRYEDYYWSKIKGEDGVAGQRGADGRQYYTWFKYADNPNGNNMSSNPSGKDYIGLAYNKTTPTASNNPQDYTWSLIRGAQGVPGKDGKTPIIHEAWADDENGLNFSIAYPSNRTPKLKGTYTDYSTIGSTNPKMYKWEPNTEFLKREMDLLKKTNEENVEAISRNEEILRNADEAMREMVEEFDRKSSLFESNLSGIQSKTRDLDLAMNNIDSAMNNLFVGSKNYLSETLSRKVVGYTGGTNRGMWEISEEYFGELKGKECTFSIEFDIEDCTVETEELYSDMKKRYSQFKQATAFIEFYDEQGKSYIYGVQKELYVDETTTYNTRQYVTFKLPNKNFILVAVSAYISRLKSGKAELSKPMLVIGNVKNSFIPSTEETETAIVDLSKIETDRQLSELRTEVGRDYVKTADYSRDTTSLKNRITSVEGYGTKISSLEQTVNGFKTEVADKNKEQDQKYSSLEQTVNGFKTTVSSVTNEQGTMKNRISALEQTDTAIKSSITAVDKRMDSVVSGTGNIVDANDPVNPKANVIKDGTAAILTHTIFATSDTCFYLNLTENLIPGAEYRLEFDCEGIQSNDVLVYGLGGDYNQYPMISLVNGKNDNTFIHVGTKTNRLLIDDVPLKHEISTTKKIKLSNFKLTCKGISGAIIATNSNIIQTAEGIRSEVTQKISGVDGKISTLGTQVDQTADSWSVKYVKSAKDIVTQINANPKGVYIKGKNIALDGDTYITNGIIKNAHIGDAQITNAKIGNAAITNAKIADAAITNAKIHDISADKITAGYIDSARIKAESITADKIDVSNLSALSADLGDIRTGRIRSYDGNFDINANNGTISSISGSNNIYISSGELTMLKNGKTVEMDADGLIVTDGTYRSRIQPQVIEVNGAVYASDYFRNANTYVPFADIVQSSGSGSSKVKELLRLGGSSNPYLHIGTDGGNYGVTAWSSDEKLKENIYRIDDDEVVEKIKKVNVYSFDWKADGTHTDYGFVAQNLQKTFPQSVFDVDGTLNINVSGIVPPMLAAIKALTNRVEWLENIINNTKLGEMNNEN